MSSLEQGFDTAQFRRGAFIGGKAIKRCCKGCNNKVPEGAAIFVCRRCCSWFCSRTVEEQQVPCTRIRGHGMCHCVLKEHGMLRSCDCNSCRKGRRPRAPVRRRHPAPIDLSDASSESSMDESPRRRRRLEVTVLAPSSPEITATATAARTSYPQVTVVPLSAPVGMDVEPSPATVAAPAPAPAAASYSNPLGAPDGFDPAGQFFSAHSRGPLATLEELDQLTMGELLPGALAPAWLAADEDEFIPLAALAPLSRCSTPLGWLSRCSTPFSALDGTQFPPVTPMELPVETASC